jgi:ADP-heptose:LPS heptosyltransferase
VDDRWRAVLDGHPDVDGIVAFPRRELSGSGGGARNRPAAFRTVMRFLRELREVGASAPGSVAIDFHGNLRSGAVLAATRATVRLGYRGHQQKEGNRWFLTHRLPSGSRRQSRMARNLALVEALGLPIEPMPDAGLPCDPAVETRVGEAVRRAVGGAAPYAVLNPGASTAQAYKKPPIAFLVAASRALARRDVRPLVVWGPDEREDAEAVVRASGGTAALAPPTTIPELAAVLRGARAFVGGDTGPMHLACAVGCPVIAIYGPTDPDVNAPWGVPSRRVFPRNRRYTGIKKIDRSAGGFEGIETGEIERAVEGILKDPRCAR